MIEDLVVGCSAHAIPCIGRRSCRRTTVAVQPAFGIFWELRRRLAPLRVRVRVRDRRPPLLRLLPPDRALLLRSVRVLRPRPPVLLLLLPPPRRLLLRGGQRVVEVSGVSPPARALRGRARSVAVLPVVPLLARVPELAVRPGAPARARAAVLLGEVDRGPADLALRVRLVLERRAGEAFVVAVRPLRAALFALDLARVDEAPLLGPLWRAAVVLIVADVLLWADGQSA